MKVPRAPIKAGNAVALGALVYLIYKMGLVHRAVRVLTTEETLQAHIEGMTRELETGMYNMPLALAGGSAIILGAPIKVNHPVHHKKGKKGK